MMRGKDKQQEALFAIGDWRTLVERRLPQDHPLRAIKAHADKVLKSLDSEFDKLYPKGGRESIPPEWMLRALLWQALYTVRSERQLEMALRFDLLCRWFVGLPLHEDAWDHSVFSQARESFLLQSLAQMFFEQHLTFLRQADLLSSEHLSVDGSLLAAWASHKSLVKREDLDSDGKPPAAGPGGRNSWVDFKGEKRSNATHVSASDPESRLASKGVGAKLSHELNIVTENRNQFVVNFTVNPPTGTSEKEAARTLIAEEIAKGHQPLTLGADRKYSDGDTLVEQMVDMGVAPHFAVRDDRPKAAGRLFQNAEGYPISQRCRMRIEEVFGYVKVIAGMAKLKVRGTLRVFGAAAIGLSAYNLTRHASLTA
jgi:transposase